MNANNPEGGNLERLETAINKGKELLKDPEALERQKEKGIDFLVAASHKLENYPGVTALKEKWAEKTPEERAAIFEDPSLLEEFLGALNLFFAGMNIKKRADARMFGTLLALGVIGGGAEDEALIEKWATVGWQVHAVEWILEAVGSLAPELKMAGEGLELLSTMQEHGAEMLKRVREKRLMGEEHDSIAQDVNPQVQLGAVNAPMDEADGGQMAV